MRANQLLERGDFAKLRIVLTDEQQIGRVGHCVLALEAHHGVRPEQLSRVFADDPVLVKVARAPRTENDCAVSEGAHEQHRDAGM